MPEIQSAALDYLRRHQLLRVLLIGILVLLLQIPIAMIDGLIGARRSTRDEALQEVTGTWGKEQTILGPALAVPYVKRWIEAAGTDQSKARSTEHHAVFLPDTLRIEAKVTSEVRYRGIFEVPVYRLEAHLTGRFEPPSLADQGVAPEDIRWEKAQIWLGIADARAIQNQAGLTLDGKEFGFVPGTGHSGGGQAGIHAPIGTVAKSGGEFSIPIVLNGSSSLALAPFGRETTVRIDSDWPDPRFQGNWLPDRRQIGANGFTAEWTVPSLGRNYPQSWTSEGPVTDKTLEASTFGFALLTPIDPYRMAERSVKYESLFLLFTFLTMWLFEVLAGRRLHSLQYLLVGAAMCLFYLLELSLAEHLGFGLAYALASASIVGLITAYTSAALQGAGRAAIIGGVVAALYGFLYVLLRNQDYALLVGSVALFIVLALVMYLTRKVDWNRVGAP